MSAKLRAYSTSAILLAMVLPMASALDPQKSLSQYKLQSWQSQGALNGGILAIAQSADGFLWVGTQRGLVRFDGRNFQPSAVVSDIRQIVARADGSLLISSLQLGLQELRNGKLLPYARPGLPRSGVRTFLEGRDGTLWVGTSRGLYRLGKERVRCFTAADGFADDIKAVLQARDGSLWIASYGYGIVHFDGLRPTRFGIRQGLPSNDVRAILEDPDGTLWFSTLGGLVRRRDGRFTTFTHRDGLSNDRLFPLWRDRDGNLWAGTEGGGLNRFAGEHFNALVTWGGAPMGEINAIFEDRAGNLWFGGADGTLYRLKDERYKVLTRHEGLSSDTVRAVFAAADGETWVGTSDGVDVIAGDRVRPVREPWTRGPVASILQDRAGRMWIGTLGDGLRRVENGRSHLFFPNRIVNMLWEDHAGAVWAGVLPGVVRIYGGVAEPLPSPIAGQRVTAFAEDRNGVIWLGAEGGAVYRLTGGAVTPYSPQSAGCPPGVLSLHVDEHDALWIGTSEGLCRFEEGRFQGYSAGDGLADDEVNSILDDGHGNFWLAGLRGFIRVSKEELRRHQSGSGPQLNTWFVERASGKATSQASSTSRGPDGRLWFGTQRGLVIIDPAKANPDTYPIPVMIEQVVVDRFAIAPAGMLRVPAGARDIEFRYVALDLGNPGGVRYRYQLEPFDRNWTEAETRQAAYYTNLPAGTYKFRVWASNGDGIWNRKSADVAFVKNAHLYETWWFRPAIAVGVSLSGMWLYRRRMSGLRARFEAVIAERNRIARELHDTVEQGLTGVMLQLDTVSAHWEVNPDTARSGLERACNMVRHCMGEARAAVRDLRSPGQASGNPAETLREMARQLNASAPPVIEVGVRGLAFPLPHDVEHALVRIGQEALTNSVKHANAARISLELEFESRSVGLRIRDDGVGFRPDSPLDSLSSGHFGLLGMRERANKLGGVLSIESAPGAGTNVMFTIPVKPVRESPGGNGV